VFGWIGLGHAVLVLLFLKDLTAPSGPVTQTPGISLREAFAHLFTNRSYLLVLGYACTLGRRLVDHRLDADVDEGTVRHESGRGRLHHDDRAQRRGPRRHAAGRRLGRPLEPQERAGPGPGLDHRARLGRPRDPAALLHVHPLRRPRHPRLLRLRPEFLKRQRHAGLCLYVGPRYRATSWGVSTLFSSFVGGLGIYAAGWVRDARIDPSRMFQFAFAIMVLCAGLLAVLARRPRLGRD